MSKPDIGGRVRCVASATAICLGSVTACAETPLASDCSNRRMGESRFAQWGGSQQQAALSAIVSIPSGRPVESFRYTSAFGMRTDPFKGHQSFHAGIDLAAPIGTEIHATADALVSRAEAVAGYGNMIQLTHGAGIETRYGHLSRIMVSAGQKVCRGDVIGLVGSTGRSTGSHLHYEVRLGGQPLNPLAFMAPGDQQMALNQAIGPRAGAASAMGGPRSKAK